MLVEEDAAGPKSEGMEQAPAAPSSATRTKQARAKNRATPGAVRARAARRGMGGPENMKHNYRGVRQRLWGKWVAEIREPNHGRRHWLGTFDTAVDAALAYDRAARAIHSPLAPVNFPAVSTAAAPGQCEPASCSLATAAASVFEEHEVEPVPAQGGGRGNAQHRDASWAAPEEMFADYLDDIAMYIDVDAVTEMVASYPDIKSEDWQVDELDTDVVDSPLWGAG